MPQRGREARVGSVTALQPGQLTLGLGHDPVRVVMCVCVRVSVCIVPPLVLAQGARLGMIMHLLAAAYVPPAPTSHVYVRELANFVLCRCRGRA